MEKHMDCLWTISEKLVSVWQIGLCFNSLVHYLFGKGSPNYFGYYFFISFAIGRSSSGA